MESSTSKSTLMAGPDTPFKGILYLLDKYPTL